MRKPVKSWNHDAILEIVHLEAGGFDGRVRHFFREKSDFPRPGHRSAVSMVTMYTLSSLRSFEGTIWLTFMVRGSGKEDHGVMLMVRGDVPAIGS